MAEPIIEVENLSKLYYISHEPKAAYRTFRGEITRWFKNPLAHSPKREELWALKDANFTVNEGEVLGVIGRNGAGKSTLLKILSRITTPTSGRAILRGRVGSLLEVGTGFHPELTGRENIFLNGILLGMKTREIKRKFDEIVAFSELEKFLDTPVKFYSSGMYVRLAFAVAAHLEPEILMIDEVLAVGDAAFQKKSLGKMSSVAKEGRTVLFVSHNMGAIQQLCSKALYLKEGKCEDLSDDVSGVVHNYLAGENVGLAIAEWKNKGNVKSEYFIPHRLLLTDSRGSLLKMPVKNDSDMWLQVEGEVLKSNPAFNIGYSVYTEDGQAVYWSFTTDAIKERWPNLKKGTLVLRVPVPSRLLNEGDYRIELNSSLHFQQWLFEPGVNSPSIHLSIKSGLSDSPYWMIKRPGIVAPVLQWEAVE